MGSTPTIIAILMCLITASHQLPASKFCNAAQSADIDTAWLDKNFETGFEVGIGCKLEPQVTTPKPQPESKSLKHQRCYLLTMNLKFGSFPIPCTCKYDKLNDQHCVLKTEASPIKQVFNFHGKVQITKTNNQTYFVTYICMNEKAKYWNAYVPSGHVLDTDTIKEIKAHVATLGFSTEDKDLRNLDKDTVTHTMARKVDCDAIADVGQSKVDLSATNATNKDDKVKSRAKMFEDVLKLLDSPLSAFKINGDQ